MLIENLRSSAIYCCGRLLYPGINSLSEEEKKSFQAGGYWENFTELAERGYIRMETTEKPTVQLVEKTYDVSLLESWLDDAPRGAVRKAIEKQIAMMNEKPEGSLTITVG